MPVKISKAAKELNVGYQHIVDFLNKNNITVDSNPNARISDEQYQMLVDAFKTDRDQKIKSEDFFKERQKEKAKPAKAEPKEELIKTSTEQLQAPKVLGKIDLSQAGKPQPKPEAPKAEVKEQPKKVETPKAKPAPAPQPKVEKKENKPQPKSEAPKQKV